MGLIKRLKKNKKGFTLVELIVVLVILAILAAIAVPTFNGYINKAKEKTSAAEARSMLLAANTIIAELNETNKANEVNGKINDTIKGNIITLADANGAVLSTITADATGNLDTLQFTSSDGIIYHYDKTTHAMVKGPIQ